MKPYLVKYDLRLHDKMEWERKTETMNLLNMKNLNQLIPKIVLDRYPMGSAICNLCVEEITDKEPSE